MIGVARTPLQQRKWPLPPHVTHGRDVRQAWLPRVLAMAARATATGAGGLSRGPLSPDAKLAMEAEGDARMSVDDALGYQPSAQWMRERQASVQRFLATQGQSLGIPPAACRIALAALELGVTHAGAAEARGDSGAPGAVYDDDDPRAVVRRAWRHVVMELEPCGAVFRDFLEQQRAASTPPQDANAVGAPSNAGTGTGAGAGAGAGTGAGASGAGSAGPVAGVGVAGRATASVGAVASQAGHVLHQSSGLETSIPAAVVGKGTVFYVVETRLQGVLVATARRRFSDFLLMLQRATASAPHHARARLPPPPKKYNTLLHNHDSPAFIEKRRAELHVFLARLVGVPDAVALPSVQAFLGLGGGGGGRARGAASSTGTPAAQPALHGGSGSSDSSGTTGGRQPSARPLPAPAGPFAAPPAMLAPSRAPVGSVKTRSGGLKFTLTFASGSSLGLAVRVRPESDTAKYAQAYSTAVHSVTPGSQGAIQGVCEGDVLLALNEGGAAGAGSGRRDSSASGGGGGLRDVPYEAVVVMVRTAPRPLKITFWRPPSDDATGTAAAPPAPTSAQPAAPTPAQAAPQQATTTRTGATPTQQRATGASTAAPAAAAARPGHDLPHAAGTGAGVAAAASPAAASARPPTMQSLDADAVAQQAAPLFSPDDDDYVVVPPPSAEPWADVGGAGVGAAPAATAGAGSALPVARGTVYGPAPVPDAVLLATLAAPGLFDDVDEPVTPRPSAATAAVGAAPSAAASAQPTPLPPPTRGCAGAAAAPPPPRAATAQRQPQSQRAGATAAPAAPAMPAVAAPPAAPAPVEAPSNPFSSGSDDDSPPGEGAVPPPSYVDVMTRRSLTQRRPQQQQPQQPLRPAPQAAPPSYSDAVQAGAGGNPFSDDEEEEAGAAGAAPSSRGGRWDGQL